MDSFGAETSGELFERGAESSGSIKREIFLID